MEERARLSCFQQLGLMFMALDELAASNKNILTIEVMKWVLKFRSRQEGEKVKRTYCVRGGYRPFWTQPCIDY
jgi:hypothetical protein